MLGQFAAIHSARHYHVREDEGDFWMLPEKFKGLRTGLCFDDGISSVAESRDHDAAHPCVVLHDENCFMTSRHRLKGCFISCASLGKAVFSLCRWQE